MTAESTAETLETALRRHIDIVPERVEQRLVKLALTLLETARHVGERLAFRPVEGGTLSEEEPSASAGA